MNSAFVKKIIAIRGEVGKKWLKDIPRLISVYENKWKIVVHSPFPLSYNFVAPARTRNGKDVVLKILLPHATEFSYEAKALDFYNGVGAVKLLREDTVKSVLLLERIMPGTRLDKAGAKEQVNVFVNVSEKIHKKIPDDFSLSFPTLFAWTKDFAIYREMYSINSGPIPKKIFEKAEEIFTQYPQEKKQKFLLHGDLHSQNILRAESGYVAIDPKGIIGEKEFEAGVFFRVFSEKLLSNADYKKVMLQHVSVCAERLNVEKQRIIDWAFATAVNGLVWFLEDEKRFRHAYFKNATALYSLL